MIASEWQHSEPRFLSRTAALYREYIDGEITREVYQRRLHEPTEQSEGEHIYDRLG